MGHATTRPRDGLRACRAARRRASDEPINATHIRDGYATAMRTVLDAQARRERCGRGSVTDRDGVRAAPCGQAWARREHTREPTHGRTDG